MKHEKSVTYGQLNRAISMFGVTFRRVADDPPTNAYEHPDRGLITTMPAYPERKKVYQHDLLGMRSLLNHFGIAEPDVFDANLQKAG